MRLQEYETKEIFNQYNIPIPPGKIARSATEAKTLAEEIGLPIVIKAQVLVGRRGKAGGIKIAETLQEVTDATNYILNLDTKGLLKFYCIKK